MSQFALTHLSELMVDQLQPGDVQVIQVIAAVALGGRRLGAALPLLHVVGQTACRLWQQPETNTKICTDSFIMWSGHNTTAELCLNVLKNLLHVWFQTQLGNKTIHWTC